MTTPGEEQPRTTPSTTPSVSTAPPRSRWRFGAVPAHLGRARTSTLVLLVLFAAVFVLWVYVRPETTGTATTGGTGTVNEPVVPAPTTSSPVPTTEAPATTTAPPTSGTTSEPSETSPTTTSGVGETSSPATSTRTTTSTSTRTTTVTVPSTVSTAPTS